VVEDLVDPRRSEPTFTLPERAMLDSWLEFHRATLELKTEGLSESLRKSRPVPTSRLSLHGLVRHMAEVERNWFRRVLAGEDIGLIWADRAVDDRELVPLDDADWETDLSIWKAECQASRDIAAEKDLEDTGWRGRRQCSLRWIYVHMIEEYARHNGHADLIRELLDGSVGW